MGIGRHGEEPATGGKDMQTLDVDLKLFYRLENVKHEIGDIAFKIWRKRPDPKPTYSQWLSKKH